MIRIRTKLGGGKVRRDSLLAGGRKKAVSVGGEHTRAKSGVVSLPGRKSPGGIDAMIAPRSTQQQARYTDTLRERESMTARVEAKSATAHL